MESERETPSVFGVSSSSLSIEKTSQVQHYYPPIIGFWYRFYVRLTLIYGGAFVILLLTMSVLFYRISFLSEMDALKKRMILSVSVLAEQINSLPDIGLFAQYPNQRSSIYRKLRMQFHSLADKDDPTFRILAKFFVSIIVLFIF